MDMAEGADDTPEIFAVSFFPDRPLHDVATEKRRVAAGGAGMRAVNEFAYSTAMALDPTLPTVSFIEQFQFDQVEDLVGVLPGVLAHIHDITKRHTSTLVKLATASGQLTGGEAALRSAGDYEAAAAVASAHLSAADAFFVAVIEATDPDPDPEKLLDYKTLLRDPVKAARRSLQRSSKAHKRAMPSAATVLGSAVIALKQAS